MTETGARREAKPKQEQKQKQKQKQKPRLKLKPKLKKKRMVYPFVLVKEEKASVARLVKGFATENPGHVRAGFCFRRKQTPRLVCIHHFNRSVRLYGCRPNSAKPMCRNLLIKIVQN